MDICPKCYSDLRFVGSFQKKNGKFVCDECGHEQEIRFPTSMKGGVVSGKMDNKAGREYDAKFLLENYKERLFRKDVAIRKAIEKLTMFGELGISEVIDLLEEAIQE